MWKHWRKDGRWLSFFFLLTCRWCNSGVITHYCCYHELSIHLSIICLFPLLSTHLDAIHSFQLPPFPNNSPHHPLHISNTQHPTRSHLLHSLHSKRNSKCNSQRNSPISNKHSNLNQLTNPSSAVSPFASGCVGSKSGESSPPRSPLSVLR